MEAATLKKIDRARAILRSVEERTARGLEPDGPVSRRDYARLAGVQPRTLARFEALVIAKLDRRLAAALTKELGS